MPLLIVETFRALAFGTHLGFKRGFQLLEHFALKIGVWYRLLFEPSDRDRYPL